MPQARRRQALSGTWRQARRSRKERHISTFLKAPVASVKGLGLTTATTELPGTGSNHNETNPAGIIDKHSPYVTGSYQYVVSQDVQIYRALVAHFGFEKFYLASRNASGRKQKQEGPNTIELGIRRLFASCHNPTICGGGTTTAVACTESAGFFITLFTGFGIS